MRSPGAPSLRCKTERLFWKQIATGITSEKTGEAVWRINTVRHTLVSSSGRDAVIHVKPHIRKVLTVRRARRVWVAQAQSFGVREVVRRLGRSPSTVFRELTRNAATRSGRLEYRASVAQWKAEQVAKGLSKRNWRLARDCATMCKSAWRQSSRRLMGVRSLGLDKLRSKDEINHIAVTVDGSMAGRPYRLSTG